MAKIKVALIPPVSQLHTVLDRQYHMVLPVGLKIPAYRKFYSELTKWSSAYLILDNGMFESGDAMSDEELLELAVETHVHEIVMPDVRDDHEATLERVSRFLRIHEQCKQQFHLMGVVQGQSWETQLKCAYEIVRLGHKVGGRPITLGLPRRSAEGSHTSGDRRIFIIRNFLQTSVYPVRPHTFHLLGLTRVDKRHSLTGRQELQYISEHYGSFVRSIDTSAPFVWAAKDARLDEVAAVERQLDYLNLPGHLFRQQLVRDNIRILEEATK